MDFHGISAVTGSWLNSPARRPVERRNRPRVALDPGVAPHPQTSQHGPLRWQSSKNRAPDQSYFCARRPGGHFLLAAPLPKATGPTWFEDLDRVGKGPDRVGRPKRGLAIAPHVASGSAECLIRLSPVKACNVDRRSLTGHPVAVRRRGPIWDLRTGSA